MTTVKYLHCSFAGSYWVDCEVLDKKENFQPPMTASQMTQALVFKRLKKQEVELESSDNPNDIGTWYQIQYLDPNLGESQVRWVTPGMLEFPRFSEYNYG